MEALVALTMLLTAQVAAAVAQAQPEQMQVTRRQAMVEMEPHLPSLAHP
jgi:hypothetical protein